MDAFEAKKNTPKGRLSLSQLRDHQAKLLWLNAAPVEHLKRLGDLSLEDGVKKRADN